MLKYGMVYLLLLNNIVKHFLDSGDLLTGVSSDPLEGRPGEPIRHVHYCEGQEVNSREYVDTTEHPRIGKLSTSHAPCADNFEKLLITSCTLCTIGSLVSSIEEPCVIWRTTLATSLA